MNFNSYDFLLFFVAVFALQRVLPHRPRNVMLLAASYFFYGSWNWRLLSLLIISTLLDYFCSWGIYRTKVPSRRRLYLTASVVGNLGMLCTFKYADFFLRSAGALFAGAGPQTETWALNLVLPVGISFYTFQTMSYTIDVYRRQLTPLRSLVDFALYVSFFPQLVAGPIERGKDLAPQMTRKTLPTAEQFRLGVWLAVWGLFKKAVIADNMARLVEPAFAAGASPTGSEVLVAAYAFAFQIYADFSGYTDIARGISKMMGYELMLNFRLPYFAKNPQEFWRRWHVSLSTWLRDYLYIPLGGNRHGRLRTYRNLFLTMLLGGLWHGAAWHFVAWGVFHGLLLVAHRLLVESGFRLEPRTAAGRRVWDGARMFFMFHLVCAGWLLFRASSLGQAAAMASAVATDLSFTHQAISGLWSIALLCSPLMLVQVLQELSGDTSVVLKLSALSRAAVYALVGLMLIALGDFGGQAFIYFQF